MKRLKKVLAFVLAVTMLFSMDLVSLAETNSSTTSGTNLDYKIVHLDCGRKSFSVDSIETIIDEAAAARFNYVQLAVGNDGMRFLLDDMSVTVNGTTYPSDKVANAIKAGNKKYTGSDESALTEEEMTKIISYAKDKGIGIIPLINTPGHMDAILNAAKTCLEETVAYGNSARTIDVTNTDAVAFTKAFLQKYISYFADKGCKLFNMGCDEYANDVYETGSMGFGQLQSQNRYGLFVSYVNAVAQMVEAADMTPMAFNDGIYYANDKSSGKFDTKIIIEYWSNGWSGYSPRSAADLSSDGFQLINTHGDYYWVLGSGKTKCTAEKASRFDATVFPGSTITNPAGACFCIWCDDPTDTTNVIEDTKDVIASFGTALNGSESDRVVSISGLPESMTVGDTATLSLSDETAATWTSSDENVVSLAVNTSARSVSTSVTSVTATAKSAGTATITATAGTATYTANVKVTNATSATEVTLEVGETKTETQENVNNQEKVDKTALSANIATVDVVGTTTEASKKTLLGDKVSINSNGNYTGVISDGNGNYLVVDNDGNISNTTDVSEATNFTVTRSGSYTYTYTIKQTNGSYYLSTLTSSSDWSTTYSLTTNKDSSTWSYSSYYGFYNSNSSYVIVYNK